MSHKATNWLADIEPARLSASEFRVLFHLCDCHNASQGCFPSQAYLRDRAGVSNGTVNNVLNALEEKGLILRHRTRDGRTKRQCPTRYILGFEMGEAQKPSPKSGDGSGGCERAAPGGKNGARRLQQDGDGAVSNLEGEPSPKNGQSRLQPTGEEPVSNQEITSARARRVSKNPLVQREAERAVARWRDGRTEALSGLQPWIVDHILGAGLLTGDEIARAWPGQGSEGGDADDR